MQRLRLFLLTATHFCVDSYATMLAPLLPMVMLRLGLGNAGAGVLGTIVSICNMSQPLLGMWADRMHRRWLVVGGIVMAAVFTPLLGIAPSYWVLVGILCLGGFGVAAFHPQAFSLAGELSGKKRGFGLALFIFGGTLGLGMTPLWVRPFAEGIGLQWLPIIAVPGLLLLLLVLRYVPLDNPAAARESPPLLQGLDGAGPGLALITVVVILRSVTGLCFGIFLAVLAGERGMSASQGDWWLAIYNTAGVVGALLFGWLSDRVDARPLTVVSLLIASPALYFFLHAEGWASYALLAVGGGFLLASNSILVALAQELVPDRSGLASSLPLGFSWGIASLSLGPAGFVADRIGLAETLGWLALLPLVTAVVALFLPARPQAGHSGGGLTSDSNEPDPVQAADTAAAG